MRPKIRLSQVADVALVLLCALVAQLVVTVSETVNWPAFNTSHILNSTLILSLACILFIIGVLNNFLGRWEKLRKWALCISISVFTSSILAIPLSATKLYLGGISVDQQFRTEFITRLTDSAHLADMTYFQLPSFYPSLWFWLAGRYAYLTGLPGWEALKPFSIITVAVCGALSYLWWRKLLPQLALYLSLFSIVVILPYTEEPYSVGCAMFFVPATITLWQALSSPHPGKKILASGLFIGFTGAIYTLYMAVELVILAVFVLNNICVIGVKQLAKRVALMGAIAIIVALPWWIPFIAQWIHDPLAITAPGGASSYLPEAGAQLYFPFIYVTVPGALAFWGLFWLITRFHAQKTAKIIGLVILTLYGWQLLSFLVGIVGTTLLSFRINPLLKVSFTAAGVLGVAELITATRLSPTLPCPLEKLRRLCPWYLKRDKTPFTRSKATWVTLLVILIWSQALPVVMHHTISRAYTDTDGNGFRADRKSASINQYYRQVHSVIAEQTHLREHDLVVLTTEFGLLALYPYWGFQSLTPHYANPLAHFASRNNDIIALSEANNTEEFRNLYTKLNTTVRMPDVWVVRAEPNGNYSLRLAENVFPNDPNVHRFGVEFHPEVFEDGNWATTRVGPFAIIIRKKLIH